jgi:stage II sporulation protein AB (anti-sigma F factor)
LEIVDCGVGIADIAKAREPLYTSCPEMERSGMGFTVMETFMDTVEVYSTPGHGTTVKMIKQLAAEEDAGNA